VSTEELENKVKEFIAFAEKIPERYREKCFEVLLSAYLASIRAQEKAIVPQKFVIPIDVRAFLQQYSVPEENIQELFITEREEIRPTYSIKTVKKAEAQIQLALLAALENALRPGGKFELSVEAVRQRCINHRVYDYSNFKTYFKKNKRLFDSLKDEEHVGLSPDGKAELAEVILEIVK